MLHPEASNVAQIGIGPGFPKSPAKIVYQNSIFETVCDGFFSDMIGGTTSSTDPSPGTARRCLQSINMVCSKGLFVTPDSCQETTMCKGAG
jgi:hypothetical protein